MKKFGKRTSGKRTLALAGLLLIAGWTGAEDSPTGSWPVQGGRETTQKVHDVLGLPENSPVKPVTRYTAPEIRYDVEFTTPDGIILKGMYAHTPVAQNAPVVVMLHEINSDRSEFDEFVGFLLANGFSALTFDLRGCGESTQTADGGEIHESDFSPDPKTEVYRQMLIDVNTALDWLENNYLADPEGIYLLGSNFGGTLAGVTAVQNASRVRGGILITPYMQYRDVRLDQNFPNIRGRDFLGICGESDRKAPNMFKRLTGMNEEFQFVTVSGAASGSELLQHPETRLKFLEFMRPEITTKSTLRLAK